MIAGAYFFCGVIFSGVNLVDNFNIEELSSLPGDKFSLCWVVLALGLMSNFFFCGAICFDIVTAKPLKFISVAINFSSSLTINLALNLNLNLVSNIDPYHDLYLDIILDLLIQILVLKEPAFV